MAGEPQSGPRRTIVIESDEPERTAPTTRHAVVAQSHGNLAVLEQMLVRLVDDGVDVIHALEATAYDVQAVLRARAQRYPKPVVPGAPGFEDFVLASVLSGVVEAPAAELARNAALLRAVRPRPEAEALHIGVALVMLGGSRAPAEAAVHVVLDREGAALDAHKRPVRIFPGHLRAPVSGGAPAACVRLRAVAQGVEVVFVGLDGVPLGPPQRVAVG